MEKLSIALVLLLTALVIGFLPGLGPTPGSGFAHAPTHITSPVSGLSPALAKSPAAPALTFPRTVLFETFTGEWCHYCPGETQAMYSLEQTYTRGQLATGEIHVCGGSPPNCYDNYMPVDQTSPVRFSYYSGSGVPTAVVDGQHQLVGALPTTADQIANYTAMVNAAAAIPGNVSITQSATVSASGVVTTHSYVTSGISGTYLAVTYLEDYIGKNISTDAGGTHDIGFVIRDSVVYQNVTLTVGGTSEFGGTVTIQPSWAVSNLSIVSFVEQYATRNVENANAAPVTTLSANTTSSAMTITAQKPATLTVDVTNSSSGTPIAGASVSLGTSAGGSFSVSSGTTGSNGDFTATYTPPVVTQAVTALITATVTAPGYTSGNGLIALLVNPVSPPSIPLDLLLGPSGSGVALGWTAPASGGGGVTYHVFRSTSQGGPFTSVGATTDTTFVDSAVQGTTSYWYALDAQNVGGFSSNCTAASATALTLVPQGIPPTQAWWAAVDSVQVNASAGSAISFHLPDGTFAYTYGTSSDAYVYPNSGQTTSVSGGMSVQVNVAFGPHLATFDLTVMPATATVVLNGATLTLTDGTYDSEMLAGSYNLTVSASGYQTQSQKVVLSPGELTPLTISLTHLSGSGPSPGSNSPSSSGLPLGVGLGLVLVIGIVGAAAVFFVALSRRRKAN